MDHIKKTILSGILIAAVAVLTWLVTFPIPATTNGFIHMGDGLIYLAAFLLGPWYGMAIGGLGSGLADILYVSPYFPVTLIVKALVGLMVGFMLMGDKGKSNAMKLFAFTVGGLIMIAGYFAYEIVIIGNAAFFSALMNLIQAAVSLVVGFACSLGAQKVPFIDQIRNR